jgi:hypothetical protein
MHIGGYVLVIPDTLTSKGRSEGGSIKRSNSVTGTLRKELNDERKERWLKLSSWFHCLRYTKILDEQGSERKSGHFAVIYEAAKTLMAVVHTALRRALPDRGGS